MCASDKKKYCRHTAHGYADTRFTTTQPDNEGGGVGRGRKKDDDARGAQSRNHFVSSCDDVVKSHSLERFNNDVYICITQHARGSRTVCR